MEKNSGDSYKYNSSFVTIALVGISILLRLIVGNSDVETKIVSILNILMLSYIIFRIMAYMLIKISNQDKNDNIERNQINACKKMVIAVAGFFSFLAIVYMALQFYIESRSFFIVANDIIAIVTFGVSIEEENIENLFLNYFCNNTFM